MLRSFFLKTGNANPQYFSLDPLSFLIILHWLSQLKGLEKGALFIFHWVYVENTVQKYSAWYHEQGRAYDDPIES